MTVLPGRGRDTTFEVSITIDGSKLPANAMNSGGNGASRTGSPSTSTTAI